MGSGGFAWEGGAELVAAPVPLQSDYIVTSDQGVAATIWTSVELKIPKICFGISSVVVAYGLKELETVR